MTRKKMTGAEALQALRDARYTYIQIKEACYEFGFHDVSIAMLCYVHKGQRKMNADLELALRMAAKGMGVKR